MACKNNTATEAFEQILPDLSKACRALREFHTSYPRCAHPKHLFDTNGLSSKYYATYEDDGKSIRFECIQNFVLKSGDLTMSCSPNGTWLGEEPVCKVARFRDKWIMLNLIVLHISILAFILLVGDFFHWRYRRRHLRKQKKISQRPIHDLNTPLNRYLRPFLIYPKHRNSYTGHRASFVLTKVGEDTIEAKRRSDESKKRSSSGTKTSTSTRSSSGKSKTNSTTIGTSTSHKSSDDYDYYIDGDPSYVRRYGVSV